jgi:hypothetical protein
MPRQPGVYFYRGWWCTKTGCGDGPPWGRLWVETSPASCLYLTARRCSRSWGRLWVETVGSETDFVRRDDPMDARPYCKEGNQRQETLR